MSNRTPDLSQEELDTIIAALYVAADIYKRDAEQSQHYPRISGQFRTQHEKCERLIIRLEEGT